MRIVTQHQRSREDRDRAGSGRRAKVEAAADERQAFAGADETESPPRTGPRRLPVEPDAAVRYANDDFSVATLDLDAGPIGAGVLGHVDQQFPHGPVEYRAR